MNITHHIINMKNPIVLFLLLLLFVSSAISEISDKTREEIEHLILRVKQSECIFNRNGTDYQGSEAVTHIITKYEYYNKEIKVTEDFIRYAATKSEFSGEKIQRNLQGSGDYEFRRLVAEYPGRIQTIVNITYE